MPERLEQRRAGNIYCRTEKPPQILPTLLTAWGKNLATAEESELRIHHLRVGGP